MLGQQLADPAWLLLAGRMKRRVVLLLHAIGDWFSGLADRLQYGMPFSDYIAQKERGE